MSQSATLAVSLFETVRESQPITRKFESWSEFLDLLGSHDFSFQRKLDVPCFSPAIYPEGSGRLKSNVTHVTFAALDLDHLSDSALSEVRDLAQGLDHLLYSTWRHAEDPNRCRLLIRLSREVQALEWAAFWRRLNALFNGYPDPKCQDPSHIYFAPSAPGGSQGSAIYERAEGEPLDVDAVLAVATPDPPKAPTNIEIVPLADIEVLTAQLKRRADPHHRNMGSRLTRVLKGAPFAEDGERDDTVFKLTSVLVDAFPTAHADSLAAIFTRSISAMTALAPGCLTVKMVADKIRRHQEQREQQRLEQEQEQIDNRALSIQEAFGTGRSHGYTEDELKGFARDLKTSRAKLKHRWVIQTKRTFYLLFNGTYLLPPATADDVMLAARRDLAPANTAGVEVFKLTKQGDLVLKSPVELVKDYGSQASKVVVSLSAQQSRYDENTRTFIEAPCPLRPLEPEYDHEVDAWLQLLCGDEIEHVLDWLSVVTQLDVPCAALYIDGYPGAGKTLLADGLARLWTTHRPTDLDQVMANFNESLTNCPLVLADETVPRDFRGKVRTSELRQVIQARTRPLSRKFQPDSVMQGAIRLIIAANNADLLNSTEALTPNDIQAIVDRLIYVKAFQSSAEYLKGVDSRSFVSEDRIAKHALWLAETRPAPKPSRFLVSGSNPALAQSLTTSSGIRSVLCHWFVQYLLEPQKIESLASAGHVFTAQKQIWTNARGLAKAWKIYDVGLPQAPSPGILSGALGGLSTTQKQVRSADGNRVRVWGLDSTTLAEWADRNGYADAQEIFDIFEKT